MELKYPVMQLKPSNWCITAAKWPQWYSIQHPHNYALTILDKDMRFIVTWKISKVNLNNYILVSSNLKPQLNIAKKSSTIAKH